MLSSVGSPTLPVGACSPDPKDPDGMFWGHAWTDREGDSTELALDFNKKGTDFSDGGKLKAVTVKLEYDGTEPKRAVTARLEDISGRITDKQVTLASCAPEKVKITWEQDPTFDYRRVVKLRMRVLDIRRGERGLVRMWGFGGPRTQK